MPLHHALPAHRGTGITRTDGTHKKDEIYHYKNFFDCYLRYRHDEQPPARVVLKTLCKRISEIDGEDAFITFKHVFEQCVPDRPFTANDYRLFCHHFMGLAKRYFPYNMAAQMFLRPLNLGPWYKGITVPLVFTGAKYFIH